MGKEGDSRGGVLVCHLVCKMTHDDFCMKGGQAQMWILKRLVERFVQESEWLGACGVRDLLN